MNFLVSVQGLFKQVSWIALALRAKPFSALSLRGAARGVFAANSRRYAATPPSKICRRLKFHRALTPVISNHSRKTG
jgi:hypothetical protein